MPQADGREATRPASERRTGLHFRVEAGHGRNHYLKMTPGRADVFALETGDACMRRIDQSKRPARRGRLPNVRLVHSSKRWAAFPQLLRATLLILARVGFGDRQSQLLEHHGIGIHSGLML